MEWLSQITEYIGALAVTMLLGLSPRINTVPPVGFKYPQRERTAVVGLSLGLLILAGVAGRAAWLPGSLLGLPVEMEPLIQMGILAMIAFAAVAALLVLRGQPWRSSGWHKNLTRPGIQFGLALVFLTLFLRGKFLTMFQDMPEVALWALLFSLVIGLAEETVFRGYLQMRLISVWGNQKGWLAASALYVLWRIPSWLVYGWGTQAFWIQVAMGILQSLLLGWMMLKSRHVLTPGLYHAVSLWVAYL